MKPGEIYKIRIDMANTSNVFRMGHRLRLEVSSSNFPRFDRNLNVLEGETVKGALVKADNTVYHDASHPSSLLLPVVK
jgi:putative CocE/NonD family hydrolase